MSRRHYTEEAMQMAVAAVKRKQLSERRAATEFNVPKSTLHDNVVGLKGQQPGIARQLMPEEEDALVKYMLYMANQGLPPTRKMTRCYIQELIHRSGRKTTFNLDDGPSDKWFRKFFNRHPELSERQPENMDRSRTSMSRKKIITDFYTFLLSVMVKFGLKNCQDQIFNCDEAGWSGREAPRTKVIAPKRGHVFRQKTTTSQHITAHLCICASGRILPTMVIFTGCLPHRKYDDGIPDSWLFGISETGYIDTDLFYKWFTQLFLRHCGQKRPVMLILDNHDAHISIQTIEAAIANDVIIVGLPGHTTHILQPLDIKVIGPLKARFSNIACHLGFTNTGFNVTKAKFPIVLKYALDQATPASVQEAFNAAGICPYNPETIDTSQLVDPLFESNNDDNNDGQEYDAETCEACGSFLLNPLVTRGLIPQSLATLLVPPRMKPVSEQQKKRKPVTEGRVISGEDMLKQLKEKEEMEVMKKEESARKKKESEEKKKEKERMAIERQEKMAKAAEERARRLKDAEEKKELRMKEMRENREKRETEAEEKRQRRELLRQETAAKRKREEEERANKRARRNEMRQNRLATTTVAAEAVAHSYICSVCFGSGEVDDEENGINWFGCDGLECGRWFHENCLTLPEWFVCSQSILANSDWLCSRCQPTADEE